MFRQLFPSIINETGRNVPKLIGMVHAAALPGTPGYKSTGWKGYDSGLQKILDQAKQEAEIFSEFEGILHTTIP